ncbi:MAG TPA: outer membrane lipoprotein carrier protein LolA [Thermoanaerobaculia bacterium]
MLRKLTTLTLLFVSLAITAARGDSSIKGTGTLERVIKEISARQRKIVTLEADFRQEKELALLSKAEVSTGHFLFAKPNRVFWNYVAPRPVQMVISDGILSTYYPELNKVETIEVKKFEDRIFRYMGATGTAMEELGKFFDFRFVETQADPFYTLELTPKTKTVAKRVRRIKIWIDRDTYLTSKFEYAEGDGDVTRYEFTNIRMNGPIGEERFSLRLPPTVRVEPLKLN